MKILVLTNKLPYPPRDGGSIATLNMITGLRDAGNQVSCMALNTTKHHFPLGEIPAELSGTIQFTGIPCDSTIRPLRMLLNLLFSRLPYIAERFNSSAFGKELTRILEAGPFDVIQLEGAYMGHYLGLIREKSGALVAFRAHNVEHMIWRRKAANESSSLKRWYLSNMAFRLELFEKEMIRRSDCLVAISQGDEEILKAARAGLPSITIPTGLSLNGYLVSDMPSPPSPFFIGALDWMPNQEGLRWFLDHVMEPLAEAIPGITVHVAGRNPPARFVKYLEKEGIIYHGEVEDARQFMQANGIMVAPLLTGSGIRIKILEAMALGRPVVTTPVGIEGIPARNGHEVMVAGDPESFKNIIIRLVKEERLASEIAVRARAFIQENFDTFKLSSRLSRFFKEQV